MRRGREPPPADLGIVLAAMVPDPAARRGVLTVGATMDREVADRWPACAWSCCWWPPSWAAAAPAPREPAPSAPAPTLSPTTSLVSGLPRQVGTEGGYHVFEVTAQQYQLIGQRVHEVIV
jgi:hypothetical protein